MTEVKGKIIKAISGFYYVRNEDNKTLECKARGVFRNQSVSPLPGDNVIVSDDNNIVSVLERKNCLVRPPVANIDQALIVFALKNPYPSFNLIDRLLAYYKALSIPTVLCFNKTDLDDEDLVSEYKNIYDKADVKLLFFSVSGGENLQELDLVLHNKTSVITGPSGVGKSSLINYLIPNANMETGEISNKLKRGKNTTRHSQLFERSDNTYIIDTPGFTSFNLDNIDYNNLRYFYPEFKKYSDKCKFSDCIHIGETDCGVKNAVNEKLISQVRYNNYIDIVKELKAIKKY